MDIYRERAHLIAHLATLYPSVLSYSDPDEPDWPVLTVDTPAGQLTWHIALTDLDLVGHVQVVPLADPRAAWDGHSTNEKYARLRALTKGTLTMHESAKPAPTAARDARTRALRTVVQGLISVALVAVAAFTVDTVTPGEAIEWGAYALGGATALGTAVAAYVQRILEGDRSS